MWVNCRSANASHKYVLPVLLRLHGDSNLSSDEHAMIDVGSKAFAVLILLQQADRCPSIGVMLNAKTVSFRGDWLQELGLRLD